MVLHGWLAMVLVRVQFMDGYDS
eukprot:COSAG02_NODE_32781_length_510_cov_17.605839_1_plen_22_part_10